MQENQKSSFINRLSIFIILGSIIILPIFFLPFVPVSLGIAKAVLFGIGVIIALVLWLLSRLIEGNIVIPKHPLVIFAWLLPLTFVISAIFSKSFGNGIWGQGFDVGTVSMMFSGAAIVFLGSLYLNNKMRASVVLGGLYISGMVAIIFSILKIILQP